MALTYTIKDYRTDVEDNTKTLVGFSITDDNAGLFIIDKAVTTGSNTKEQIISAAQLAAQPEIDEWLSVEENVGKVWNPDTQILE